MCWLLLTFELITLVRGVEYKDLVTVRSQRWVRRLLRRKIEPIAYQADLNNRLIAQWYLAHPFAYKAFHDSGGWQASVDRALDAVQTAEVLARLNRIQASLKMQTPQYRPFILPSCRTIGTSFNGFQETGELWLLQGAGTPFLLRPEAGKNYSVIGPAYVEDYMHGEALQSGWAKNEQTILLV